MKMSKVRALFIITMILFVIAFICFIIGFCTNYWEQKDWSDLLSSAGYGGLSLTTSAGLWKYCMCGYLGSIGSCECFGYDEHVPGEFETFFNIIHGSTDVEAWLQIVRAFECIGLAMLVIGGGIMISQLQRVNKPIYVGAIISVYGGGLCMIVGAIVYGVKHDDSDSAVTAELKKVNIHIDDELHYSFGLIIVGSILAMLCATIMVYDLVKYTPPPSPPPYTVSHPQQHMPQAPYGVQYTAPGYVVNAGGPYVNNQGVSNVMLQEPVAFKY